MSNVLKKHEALMSLNEGEIFDFVWNHAVEGMAIVSPKGEWLAVNPIMSNWLGYSAPELENMTFMDVTEPADVKADLDAIDEVLRGIRPAYTMVKRYKPKSGIPFDAKLTVFPWKDTKEGTVLFFYSQTQKLEPVEYKKVDELRVTWNFVRDNKRSVLAFLVLVALAGDGFITWIQKAMNTLVSLGQ